MPITLDGTSGVTYPDGVTQASGIPAPSTSGNVLTSNGTAWTSAPAGGGFPTGTRMSFQQTAAPTGWTKDTTAAINDSILRFVTGSVSSGGSLAFSTWAAQTSAGATTLSTTQIPSHTHPYVGQSSNQAGYNNGSENGGTDTTKTTSATGGGGSHTHSLSQSLKYYDFIIASKD